MIVDFDGDYEAAKKRIRRESLAEPVPRGYVSQLSPPPAHPSLAHPEEASRREQAWSRSADRFRRQTGISMMNGTLDDERDSGCLCHRCERRYRVDLLVEDGDWERIKPKGSQQGAGLLCGPCILEALEGAGCLQAYRLVKI